MDFEAIPLYNKIRLGPATLKEVRKVTNEHVLQKQKNVLGRSKAVSIKNIRFVTTKKGLLKKENKRTINDRTRFSRCACLTQ